MIPEAPLTHHPRRRRLVPRTLLAGVLAAAVAVPVPAFAGPTPLAAPETGPAAAGSDPLTLWYDEPAADWETQALPIGNGALGGMIFGRVANETVQFNEKTLWTGGPGAPGYNFGNWTSPRPNAIADIQALINQNGRISPQEVANKLGQPKSSFGSYQSFGDLSLRLTEDPGTVQEYRRELNIGTALAKVSYVDEGVRYTREYFASNPDNVLVVRLSADQPGKVGFTAGVTAANNRSKTTTATGGRITFAGALNDNKLKYESQIQVNNDGGTRTDGTDGTVTVAGANSATLVLAAGTDYAGQYPTYRGTDPHAAVTGRVDTASAKSYADLLAAHQADYKALFDRVNLDLGQVMPNIPTDEAAHRLRQGQRRSGPRPGEPLLPVRPLPAGRLVAGRVAAGEPPGRVEQLHQPALGRGLPRQHQPPDELLAGGGHEPLRDHRPAVRLRRRDGGAGQGHRPADLR